MAGEIEQRILLLSRRQNVFYLFNNKKVKRLIISKAHRDTDMQWDVCEAEELIDEFFSEFQVARGKLRLLLL